MKNPADWLDFSFSEQFQLYARGFGRSWLLPVEKLHVAKLFVSYG